MLCTVEKTKRIFLFSLQVSANGNVLRSEIVGAVKMRVYLSGMPELRLGLNDKVLFESTGREYKSSMCQLSVFLARASLLFLCLLAARTYRAQIHSGAEKRDSIR